MTELIFVVCLGLTTPACEERSMLFAETPPQLCALRAQAELAVWSGRNPRWTLRRWACRPFDPSQHDS
ncbi:hypothetical protein LAZ40_03070 [Cereibacter sphaeroides]|uniref:hypothetical protein n=1 Tax=Rhodobacterales TaxID=204455 RepID=UPI000BBF35E2|nr:MULTISPECIES: hypothetical protein [Paracoccaceae]MCE6958036.1 hypothetical protein [Cereibacter sphaeroides]MCE6971971.1 hypothetical protein [Cereibacter sphaeroides]